MAKLSKRVAFQKFLGILAILSGILSLIFFDDRDGTFALFICPFGLYIFFTKTDLLNLPDYDEDEYDYEEF